MEHLTKKTTTSDQHYSTPILERGLFLVAATMAVLAWLVMFARIMSDLHPIWDLASHLSWHVWVAMSFVLFVSTIGLRWRRGEPRVRWWHRCIMAVPPWAYFSAVTLPWTVLPLAQNRPDSQGLKIVAWNIWMMNQSPSEVLRLLQEVDADVVAIIELGNEHADALKQLESTYPHRSWLPDNGGRGMAMLSRVPDTQFRTIDLADQGMPAIEARIPETDKHRGYRLISVHTRSPDLHQRTLDRNLQLNSLSEWANLSNEPGIIVGDLNITPWSPPFSRLVSRSKLRDSRSYRGHFASWPTDLSYFGIPIDHALVTWDVDVLYRGVGIRAPDSDHRPITLIVR